MSKCASALGRITAAALVCLVLTGGCWSRKELGSLGFVLDLGIDRAAEEDKIMLTARIAKPFAIATGTMTTVDEKPYWQVSSTGRTAFEAMRNFRQQSPRRPITSHSRFIIIGEDFARAGIGETIDFLSREGEAREDVAVVVAKGVKASDLMESEFELERLPSKGGLGIMKTAKEELSTVVETTLNDFLQMLEIEGVEPVASRAELVPRPLATDPRGQLKREVVTVSSRFTGAAAFKGDRLVGWLDKTQTRGLQWVRGKVRSGIIVIMQPGEGGSLTSLEILRSTGKIVPRLIEGRLSILVKVSAEGNLGEVQEFMDPMEGPDLWMAMERRMATAIQEEIESALDIAQQKLNSDIFGFGAAIFRKYPREWMKHRDTWGEEFPGLDVQIEVKAKLRRSGLTRRSAGIGTTEEREKK